MEKIKLFSLYSLYFGLSMIWSQPQWNTHWMPKIIKIRFLNRDTFMTNKNFELIFSFSAKNICKFYLS